MNECGKCGQQMSGQFVRALGKVYHLDCFRCHDCNNIVATKFFPIENPDSPPYPLCETDYFRRLNLLCSKCHQALRGSYITALDMKFHVEHFTCSVCPTVFGPSDSYYEHGGDVYCHFHYSTRFAVKCVGCNTAILKQFIELYKNNSPQHWHPECYMINKFWNIKLDPPPPIAEGEGIPENNYELEESKQNPTSIKASQEAMEVLVNRIWTVMSRFEESSAASISEMLRFCSTGYYLQGVSMAEKFVWHVVILFAAMDDISLQYKNANLPAPNKGRESRVLCKQIVAFFTVLNNSTNTRSISPDLVALVTGLAHFLKIHIRIALTTALRLEEELTTHAASQEEDSLGTSETRGKGKIMDGLLQRLEQLSQDPELGIAANSQGRFNSINEENAVTSVHSDKASLTFGSLSPNRSQLIQIALQKIEGKPPVPTSEPPTDLCFICRTSIEEACVRSPISKDAAHPPFRWHVSCIQCTTCLLGTKGTIDTKKSRDLVSKLCKLAQSEEEAQQIHEDEAEKERGRAELDKFGMEIRRNSPGAPPGAWATTPYCLECLAKQNTGTIISDRVTLDSAHSESIMILSPLIPVSVLEQYAFLLVVALNKLYLMLVRREYGMLEAQKKGLRESISSNATGDSESLYETYRDSTDIKRMKSVHLDRKLSSAMARLPQRSVVVQSPTGRVALTNDPNQSMLHPPGGKPPVPSRKDQPILDPSRTSTVPRPSVAGAHYTQSAAQAPPQGLSPSLQRPGLNNRPTQIRIISENQPAAHLGASAPNSIPSNPTNAQSPLTSLYTEPPGPGGSSNPTTDETGLTLGDLAAVYGAAQARERNSLYGNDMGQTGVWVASLGQKDGLGGPTAGLVLRHLAAVCAGSEFAPEGWAGGGEEACQEDLLEFVDVRKKDFWGKLFKGKKDVKKKGVFGIPLEVLVETKGTVSTNGCSGFPLRVPTFVEEVIQAMQQMDMSIEGIFRKNGNIRRLKDLTDSINNDANSVNLSDDNPVQLAALLKKFLRELPEPLMTFKLFPLFIQTQKIKNLADRKTMLHYIVCLLPKAHRDTLELICVFFKWVASFSHVDEDTGSKMDIPNLAMVICPNILYSKSRELGKDESFMAIEVVQELLTYQDEFFHVPARFLSALQDSQLVNNPEITSKEILQRIEPYLRGTANKRAPSNSTRPPPTVQAEWQGSNAGSRPPTRQGSGGSATPLRQSSTDQPPSPNTAAATINQNLTLSPSSLPYTQPLPNSNALSAPMSHSNSLVHPIPIAVPPSPTRGARERPVSSAGNSYNSNSYMSTSASSASGALSPSFPPNMRRSQYVGGTATPSASAGMAGVGANSFTASRSTSPAGMERLERIERLERMERAASTDRKSGIYHASQVLASNSSHSYQRGGFPPERSYSSGSAGATSRGYFSRPVGNSERGGDAPLSPGPGGIRAYSANEYRTYPPNTQSEPIEYPRVL